jgi:hypothetical protein
VQDAGLLAGHRGGPVSPSLDHGHLALDALVSELADLRHRCQCLSDEVARLSLVLGGGKECNTAFPAKGDQSDKSYNDTSLKGNKCDVESDTSGSGQNDDVNGSTGHKDDGNNGSITNHKDPQCDDESDKSDDGHNGDAKGTMRQKGDDQNDKSVKGYEGDDETDKRADESDKSDDESDQSGQHNRDSDSDSVDTIVLEMLRQIDKAIDLEDRQVQVYQNAAVTSGIDFAALIGMHCESRSRLQLFRSTIVQDHAVGTLDIETARARTLALTASCRMRA